MLSLHRSPESGRISKQIADHLWPTALLCAHLW